MVLTFWQVPASEKELADSCPSLPGQGIRARDLRDMARKQGLHSYLIHATWEDLKTEVSLSHPLIVGLVKPTAGGGLTHYEVVVAVHPEKRIVVTQDPAKAWRQYPWEGFRKEWEPAGFLTLVFSREDSRPGPPSPGP
jgi:ABC-type bacteriocin/lantibiotic exporter with double-glycine peptidase domain